LQASLSFLRRDHILSDHQGILAGAREGWNGSLLFRAADLIESVKFAMNASIS
jgi:hypothetical protein